MSLAVSLILLALAVAGADHADHLYLPPVERAALHKSLHPVAQEQLKKFLREPLHRLTISDFAGRNEALATDAPFAKFLEVAADIEVDLPSAALLDTPRREGQEWVYLAEIRSEDAYGIRLQVDLSRLRPGEELFVIDPNGPRAYGPYTVDHHIEGGTWLATVEGERAVIMVRSPLETIPDFTLLRVSHFFRPFISEKELSCNINVDCADGAISALASAVGMMIFAVRGGGQGICTGNLINNAATAEEEPYLLTANHCIPQFGDVSAVEVIWDFRTGDCDSTEAPELSTLPRSTGVDLLATCDDLDITLMELDAVPGGVFGRTYLGWDLREPAVDEKIIGIHHPDGTHMRVSFGDVTSINQRVFVLFTRIDYFRQTRVLWGQGVTEGGSSGSCLLFDDGNLRIFGTLSNGVRHTCADTSGNFDDYSSFRDFFPQVEAFLTTHTKPPPQLVCDFRDGAKLPGCAISDGLNNGKRTGGMTDLIVLLTTSLLLVIFKRQSSHVH